MSKRFAMVSLLILVAIGIPCRGFAEPATAPPGPVDMLRGIFGGGFASCYRDQVRCVVGSATICCPEGDTCCSDESGPYCCSRHARHVERHYEYEERYGPPPSELPPPVD